MSEFSYDSIVQRFLEVAPNLRRAYRHMLEDWDDETPGSTIVLDDIVSPYLIGLLRSPDSNQTHLLAVFSFLEEMARHEDRRVRDALAVTVGEHILGHEDIYAAAQLLMGPATRNIVDEIASNMGVTAWRVIAANEPDDSH